MYDDQEGSTKIVNFLTPWAVVLVLGFGHTSHYRECIIFNSINVQLHKGIVIMLPYAIVEFYLFYDGAVDIQI